METIQELEKLSNKKLQELRKYHEVQAKRFDNLQTARKLLLNSCYGALGSPYFRFYDPRQATAITLSGQTAIRWVAGTINNYMIERCGSEKDRIIAIDTDSVVGETLIYVDGTEMKISDYYDNCGNNFVYGGEKTSQAVKIPDYGKTISYDGSTINERNINYVMKHRVNKEMFRVSVGGKEVIITEDHSLIVERNGELLTVKPKEVVDTDMLVKVNSGIDAQNQ